MCAASVCFIIAVKITTFGEKMTRRTSIEAYERVKESGVLSRRRFQTYDILFKHGPLTGSEVSAACGIYGLWKRCSELLAFGLVEVVGEKKCQFSGMTVSLWDVTDRAPVEMFKRVTSKQRIKALEQEVTALKLELEKYRSGVHSNSQDDSKGIR